MRCAEEAEDDAAALPEALETLAAAARAALAGAAEELVAEVVCEVAARAERAMLRQQYARADGLRVERRARRLAAWAGSAAGGARDRCARLTQCAQLLALERAAHAPDALLPAPRLAPGDARDLLARRYTPALNTSLLIQDFFVVCMLPSNTKNLVIVFRTDFKMEEIKRLKL